jgi:hypothetical protein
MESEQNLAPVAHSATTTAPAATARQTVFAVLWSFFGVRKMANLDRDMQTLKPQWLLLTALAGAGLFIGTLITLVKLAVKLLTP